MTERVVILFSRARREEVQRHNEQVRQNRETLKTISEAMLFLSKHELAFRCHDESRDGLSKKELAFRCHDESRDGFRFCHPRSD